MKDIIEEQTYAGYGGLPKSTPVIRYVKCPKCLKKKKWPNDFIEVMGWGHEVCVECFQEFVDSFPTEED